MSRAKDCGKSSGCSKDRPKITRRQLLAGGTTAMTAVAAGCSDR